MRDKYEDACAAEAKNLDRLFYGVNQAEFARKHQVPGGASMVSQHIKGRRAISMEAAIAYAKGFNLPLSAISNRLHELALSAGAASQNDKLAFARTPHAQTVAFQLAQLMAMHDRPRRDGIGVVFEHLKAAPQNEDAIEAMAILLEPNPVRESRRAIAKAKQESTEHTDALEAFAREIAEQCANIDPSEAGVLASDGPGEVWKKFQAAILRSFSIDA